MSDEKETPENEDDSPLTLTEAVAALSDEERGVDPDAVETPEAPAKEAAERPAKTDPTRYQIAGRRGARELRKLERAAKDLEAREKAAALAAQERAELEEARALAKLQREDPAAFAEKTGLDIDRMTTSWLEKTKPDAKLSALEKRLDAEKAEREKSGETARAAETRARIEAAEKTFISALAEKAEDYPAIADLEPHELFDGGRGLAYQVSREIKAEMDRLGYPADKVPSDEQIMRELNAREEAKLAKRAARLGYSRGAVAPAERLRPTAVPSGRTIQGAATRQRAAAPPPEPDFSRSMSSGDRARVIAEELEKERRRAAGGRLWPSPGVSDRVATTT